MKLASQTSDAVWNIHISRVQYNIRGEEDGRRVLNACETKRKFEKKTRESRITTRTLIERVYWANSGKPPDKQRILAKISY